MAATELVAIARICCSHAKHTLIWALDVGGIDQFRIKTGVDQFRIKMGVYDKVNIRA